MEEKTPEQLAREEEERAAEERSRAMNREVVARHFAEVFWPAERVLGWIAFRDPAHIEDNLRRARWYRAPASLRNAEPRATLLSAVQDGSLSALRDGAELPREAWANATGPTWPDDIRFRREDVLKLWPAESEGIASPAIAPAKSVPTVESAVGRGAPGPHKRPRVASKGDKIEQALMARGFHRDRQGNSCKEIARIIENQVGTAFGAELGAREKAVWRALKRLE